MTAVPAPAPISAPAPITAPAAGEFTARLWQRFRPLVVARIDVLDQCVAAHRRNRLTPRLRADGAAAAHNLTGTLDSYGRTGGSAVAAEVEHLLRDEQDPGPRLAQLVDALWAVMDAS